MRLWTCLELGLDGPTDLSRGLYNNPGFAGSFKLTSRFHIPPRPKSEKNMSRTHLRIRITNPVLSHAPLAIFLAFAFSFTAIAKVSATALPDGFAERQYAHGLTNPTAMAFALIRVPPRAHRYTGCSCANNEERYAYSGTACCNRHRS